MMKMTGKAFAKKLFGAKYERLPRTILLDVIIFWGLYIAGFQVQIAASVRILMINAFTAGIMWQALSSRDNTVELKHMLMLPQQPKEFVFSYVAVLGGGTIGLFTMQWAKIFGSRKVVVFDISEERLELAKRLGADEVINTTKEGFLEQAKEQ